MFHLNLDAMSTQYVCDCCGEERGSQHNSDKVNEEGEPTPCSRY